jgi:glycine betaine/proline transport system ATP-binding protein
MTNAAASTGVAAPVAPAACPPRDVTPMISVRGVWKVFGHGDPDRAIELAEAGATRAEIQAATGHTVGVRDISFEVGRGETFVVMGLSGSGKSSLVRCLARLIEPTRGEVMMDGIDILRMSPDQLRGVRRSKMSMVFQHFGLFPHRRVIDNVAYGLEVQGIDRATRRRRAGEVLETVGLSAWADHYPQQLSGGMQQRVGLARALVLDPEILFFDEPFSALDPLIRRDMQDELLALQHRRPRTIVFITHDFDEALRLGDRIAIMKDGVFDQIGTSEAIVGAPATDYVREFTTDVPRARVMSAATVMRPFAGDGVARRTCGVDDKVDVLVARLLHDPTPITVVDADGAAVGVIGPAEVVALLTARPTTQGDTSHDE